jgi:hypothetical protein
VKIACFKRKFAGSLYLAKIAVLCPHSHAGKNSLSLENTFAEIHLPKNGNVLKFRFFLKLELQKNNVAVKTDVLRLHIALENALFKLYVGVYSITYFAKIQVSVYNGIFN